MKFLLIAIFACSFAAWAENEDEGALQRVPDRTVTVGVPQSEIALEPIRYKPPTPVEFEFSASTITPRNFVRGSFNGAASKFTNTDIPELSINRFAEWFRFNNGIVISSKFGLSYLQMGRSMTTGFSNISEGPSKQTMNMFMGRVGVEGAWRNLLPWGFEPNVSLAVLPTYAMAEQSVYEESIAASGFPFEGTVGLLWRSDTAGHGNISVGVEGQALTGVVGGSTMNGYGVEGLFRISL